MENHSSFLLYILICQHVSLDPNWHNKIIILIVYYGKTVNCQKKTYANNTIAHCHPFKLATRSSVLGYWVVSYYPRLKVIFSFSEKFPTSFVSFRNVPQQLYYNIYCSVYVGGAFQKVFPHWFVGRFAIKGTEWNEMTSTSTSSICFSSVYLRGPLRFNYCSQTDVKQHIRSKKKNKKKDPLNWFWMPEWTQTKLKN